MYSMHVKKIDAVLHLKIALSKEKLIVYENTGTTSSGKLWELSLHTSDSDVNNFVNVTILFWNNNKELSRPRLMSFDYNVLNCDLNAAVKL